MGYVPHGPQQKLQWRRATQNYQPEHVPSPWEQNLGRPMDGKQNEKGRTRTSRTAETPTLGART
eukprot:8406196-Pyramimonas_sp.AAC.1